MSSKDSEMVWVSLELLCGRVPENIDAALTIAERNGYEIDRDRVKVRLPHAEARAIVAAQ